MAQFTGPRHPPQGALAPAVRVGPAGTAAVDDRTWFDSSWELRKGLDVAELPWLPEEGMTAPGMAPFNPDASPR